MVRKYLRKQLFRLIVAQKNTIILIIKLKIMFNNKILIYLVTFLDKEKKR